MSAVGLASLHDATLLNVRVEWRTGIALIELAPVEMEKTTLRATGLRLLRVPRGHPWGSSVSVNVAELMPGENGHSVRLRIEMQSGDEIELDADAVELRIAGASGSFLSS